VTIGKLLIGSLIREGVTRRREFRHEALPDALPAIGGRSITGIDRNLRVF